VRCRGDRFGAAAYPAGSHRLFRGRIRRLNSLAVFLDINSEFNLLNASLVVSAGCQFIFSIAR
jgi:hypothetical protein